MSRHNLQAGSVARSRLIVGVSAAAMALASSAAMAGGFSSRQQSVAGQGFSFAGAGTSAFGIGSMFWNPANITNFEGRRSEWNFTVVAPYFSVTSDRLTNGTGALNFFGPPTNIRAVGSGNINHGSLTTASYNSFQVNNWLWLGLQTGAPFGSRTRADQGFAGSVYGTSTVVRGLAVTPTAGVKVNEWLAFGVGLTVQQLNVTLNGGDPRFAPLGPAAGALTSYSRLKGDGYGIGWTAGATIKPLPGTEISLGYRSHIKHQLDGELDFTAPVALVPGLASRLVRANVNLPEIATLGISQQLNAQWTVTGTVQWTNWSRLKTAPVVNRVSGVPITGLGFRYKDEWFVALGAQYALNDAWKLRAGIAYEKSPVTDENRGVRVLDSDRLWLSLGAAYKITDKLELDISYSHIFTKNGKVDIVGAGNVFNPAGNPGFNGAVQFNGRSKGHLDLVGLSLKYRWDTPAPEPVRPVVAKY